MYPLNFMNKDKKIKYSFFKIETNYFLVQQNINILLRKYVY